MSTIGQHGTPAAWYRLTEDSEGKWPREHLSNFDGWLHADGYAGFEELYRGGRIKEIASLLFAYDEDAYI